MRHESDYFQPIRELEREASEFLNFKNIHEWYNTNPSNEDEFTSFFPTYSLAKDITDCIERGDSIQEWFTFKIGILKSSTRQFIEDLEQYELFELCQLVKQKTLELVSELEELESKCVHLYPEPIKTPIPTPIPTPTKN